MNHGLWGHWDRSQRCPFPVDHLSERNRIEFSLAVDLVK